ncbi:Ankyrin repeat-containing protein [Penicillium tannophilum]|nr:Ankyrin repeat-containing protein [Penicillium tannophilum]
MMCSPKPLKMLKLLISLGLNVNHLPAKDDNYPIHLAAVYGDREFLKALLLAGADFSLPGPYGQTAHEIAKEYARVYQGEYVDMVRFLVKETFKELGTPPRVSWAIAADRFV